MPVETLSLPNYSANNLVEEGELSADAAASQAVVSLLNTSNFLTNDYVAINPGEETGEIKQILSVLTTQLTFTSNLSLQHRNHERAVKVFGNQIRVYKATDTNGLPPLDASFSLLGTATIDPDQPFSFYTDNGGGIGFWYKFTYYNPTSAGETDISLSEATRGGGYEHYVSIEDIRAEAGLADSRRLDDTQVSGRRDEAESEVKGKLAAAGYIMPLQIGTGTFYIPQIVRNITRQLAAGLILYQNFGVTKPDSSKDGAAKQKAARSMLDAIQANKIVLLDSNEQALTKSNQVSGWPDSSTATFGTDGVTPEPANFTMGMKF